MAGAESRVRARAAVQDGLVTAQQAQADGLRLADLGSEVRSGRWRAMLRGVYLVDADMYADGVAARVWWRAALLAHGPDTCLVAGTAARALGIQGLPLSEPLVEIAHTGGMPRRLRRAAESDPPTIAAIVGGPAVMVRQLVVSPDEFVEFDGLRVRHPRHTIVDAAIELDRARALSVMDSALHQQLVTPAELALAILAAKGRPGIQQLRPLAAYADGRAESPVESRVRLCCIDGRVAPDDLQYAVRDGQGHIVAVGDLGWHRHRSRPLLAEADGEEVHGRVEAVYRDRTRGNALTAQACDTVRFTFADTLRRGYVANVVRQALVAAA